MTVSTGHEHHTIDRPASATRIERHIETLGGPDYTSSTQAIRRYAYTPEYRRTIDYFAAAFRELGYDVGEDPLGTFVARNRPAGTPVFGLGSHCDSNRNGGKYDGTLGVVVALEVCTLAAELGLDLPLQVVSFLEEEGSGFGLMLLGSRIVAGQATERELREVRAVDDGESLWTHAERAGHQPARWRECSRVLDDLTGWLELHIEQGRVLQDLGLQIGVVEAIAGYVHADLVFTGRADHAGATPMGWRADAGLAAAETALEAERLAEQAGEGTVATVGRLELEPGLINVVPGGARMSLDVRSADQERFEGVARDLERYARKRADARSVEFTWEERVTVPATRLDAQLVQRIEHSAEACGTQPLRMISGAAHDTMYVAPRVPSAMVFVPCEDGISHSPHESADPRDAALGAEIMLNAIAAST